jgi:polyphosphate kinase
MNSAAKEIFTQSKLPNSLLHDRLFLFNRELSWLEFNRRVLAEAQNQANPILERLKFLSIFSTNLDEFFMIRVSGLKEQIVENVTQLSPDGMSPAEQIREIRNVLRPMLTEQISILHKDILPKLADAGITIHTYDSLSPSEKTYLNNEFMRNVFPVITPQAVDASHPFPYISNLSLNLGVILEPIGVTLKHLTAEPRFARIKLPPNVPRLIAINEEKTKFAMLGEVLKANAHELFAGMKMLECHLFRVTRDADIEIREDEAGDLLRTMEAELHRRRFRFPVRLEISASMSEEMSRYLASSIGLTEQDVYRIDGFLNIADMMLLYSLERPDLKDKPILPTIPNILRKKKSVFEAIKQQDILLHHPYTSYNTVTDFINAAAEDEDVQAIKICLYRTGKDSPIVKALMHASQEGKQVTALVELKARFDEENNIEWAKRLENEGVHVIYGMKSLKTHSKVALVVRREENGLKRYVHIATGNYNPTTSRIYTDLGLLTCDEEIGADASDLFNFLTGYSQQTEYRQLLVAPVNMREQILNLIKRETEHKLNGKDTRIIIKANSLTDVEIIHELYKASETGVKISLIIRGICMLKPEIAEISENIEVISIVGRFLEHSRIFYFANGGDDEVYIGSADLMSRNLNRRVEVIVPIKDTNLRQYIKDEILNSYLQDNSNTKVLRNNGIYEKRLPSNSEVFNAQQHFANQ